VPRKVNRGFAAPEGGVTTSGAAAGEKGEGAEEYGIVTGHAGYSRRQRRGGGPSIRWYGRGSGGIFPCRRHRINDTAPTGLSGSRRTGGQWGAATLWSPPAYQVAAPPAASGRAGPPGCRPGCGWWRRPAAARTRSRPPLRPPVAAPAAATAVAGGNSAGAVRPAAGRSAPPGWPRRR